MKKVITIEYEPGGPTPSCNECPFFKQHACDYLERIDINCADVKINEVTIKDE